MKPSLLRLLPILALVAAPCLPLQGAQSVLLTSFEASEGFEIQTRKNANGWTLPTGSFSPGGGLYAYATNARALEGSMSLAIHGGHTQVASRSFNPTLGENFTSLSYSFITPGTFTGTPNTSITYAFLKDDSRPEVNARALRIITGLATGDQSFISIGLALPGGGYHTSQTNFSRTALDFNQWQTLSLQLDPTAQTLSIHLGPTVILDEFDLSGTWSNFTPERIEQIWLAAPNTSTTYGEMVTYYDRLIVTQSVPEGHSLTLLLGTAALLYFTGRHPSLKSGKRIP